MGGFAERSIYHTVSRSQHDADFCFLYERFFVKSNLSRICHRTFNFGKWGDKARRLSKNFELATELSSGNKLLLKFTTAFNLVPWPFASIQL